MPKAPRAKRPAPKHLCSATAFAHYLNVEIARYTRYQRTFTVVLIQTPIATAARLEAVRSAAEQTRKLTRDCDVVTSIETSGLVITLLPETSADGARAVFDRVGETNAKSGTGWTIKMATYPEHFAIIDYLRDRIDKLLRDGQGPASAAKRDTRLWREASDITDSWQRPSAISAAVDTKHRARLS